MARRQRKHAAGAVRIARAAAWVGLFAVAVLAIASLASADISFQGSGADPEVYTYTKKPYDKGHRKGALTFTDSLKNTVQKKSFPVRVLNALIYDSKHGGIEFSNIKSDVIDYGVPILVAFGFGIAMGIIMWLTGLIFGCLRLCGLCGGKLVQEKESTKERKWLIILMLISLSFLLAGVIIAFVGNSEIGETRTNIIAVGGDTFHNVNRFVRNTFGQVTNLAMTQIIRLVDWFKSWVATVGVDAVPRLYTALNGTAIQIFNSLDGISANIESLKTTIPAVNSTIYAAKAQVEGPVTTDLGTVRTRADAVRSNGQCDAACQALIPAGSTMSTSPVFSSPPDLSGPYNAVKGVSLASDIATARSKYVSVGADIEDTLNTTRTKAVTELTKFQSTLNKTYVDVKKFVDDFVTDTFNADKKTADLNDALGSGSTAEKFDNYRSWAGYAIVGVAALAWFLATLGLVLGLCGHDSHRLPGERTATSNHGGNMLIASTFFSFFISLFIWWLCALFFLLSMMTTRTCDIISAPTFYPYVIDNTTNWDGYLLGRAIHNNASLPVRLGDLLSGCGNDMAPWSLLQMDRKFNLTAKLSYRDEIDLSSVLNFTVNAVNVASASLTNAMNNYVSNSQLGNIDFNALQGASTAPIVSFDPAALIRNISIAYAATSDAGLQTALKSLNDSVVQLGTDVAAVDSLRAPLAGQVSFLKTVNATLPNQVSQTLNNITTFATTIATVGTQIAQDIVNKALTSLFGTLDNFVGGAVAEIQTRLGHCKAVSDSYEYIRAGVCQMTTYNVDMFWFGLGITGFFLIPTIILNVRLAKYFRRMRDEYFDSHEKEYFQNDFDKPNSRLERDLSELPVPKDHFELNVKADSLYY
eukprot:Opistho-1_new@79918